MSIQSSWDIIVLNFPGLFQSLWLSIIYHEFISFRRSNSFHGTTTAGVQCHHKRLPDIRNEERFQCLYNIQCIDAPNIP